MTSQGFAARGGAQFRPPRGACRFALTACGWCPKKS